MKLLIEAEPLSEDVWCADLSSAELSSLGSGGRAIGAVWVVLLSELPTVRKNEMILESAHASILNRGTTTKTVFITSADVRSAPGLHHEQGHGDVEYLEHLPASLRSLGESLLEEVRMRWPGDLRPTPSGRFIESPDNFWTVKIQPRDGSLRLTVRGVPERLRPAAELGLKDDRPGYSTFKVRTSSDVPLAIAVLGRAPRR